MVRCVLVLGRTLIQSYEVDGAEVSIGRDLGQDIRIDNDAISRRHAVMQLNNGVWTVQDLNTSNGTLLNGKRIDFAPLKPGDEIILGKHTLFFEPTDSQLARLERGRPAMGVSQRAGTLFLATDELESVMRRMGEERAAHLRLLSPASRERRYPLGAGETILGKAVDADVVLTGFFLSGAHAVIERDRQGFTLRATGTLRAVRVNGRRIRERRLENRDVITIGPNKLQFFDEVK